MVTEVSGSGKATMILESLLSALNGMTQGEKFPEYVIAIGAEKFEKVKLIDVVPVGINVRSAVAIYAGVHDELRKIFARQLEARELGYKAEDFSYNTGKLLLFICDGTGCISLEMQTLLKVFGTLIAFGATVIVV